MNSISYARQSSLNDGKSYIPEIREILKLDGNNTCADCFSPNVSCVSLRFRVILCDKCAYVLICGGYEVPLLTSKHWDPQILNALKTNNNAKSRQIYEATKPSWQITPFGIDSQIVREYWFNEKYINESFVRNDEENEEHVYKTIMKRIEEVEKKKMHEEIMRNNWYYLEAGETETLVNGPLTKFDLISLLNHDQIDESFYCWHPSLDTWEQIIDVKELDLDKRGNFVTSKDIRGLICHLDFKIIKDTKSIIDSVTPKMLKYVPRSLRGYLEYANTFLGPWKKCWAIFNSDFLNLYKSPPVKLLGTMNQ